MKAIDKVIKQLKKERPQTDFFDAWNYLKYKGFRGLNLTKKDKQELLSFGNEIRKNK